MSNGVVLEKLGKGTWKRAGKVKPGLSAKDVWNVHERKGWTLVKPSNPSYFDLHPVSASQVIRTEKQAAREKRARERRAEKRAQSNQGSAAGAAQSLGSGMVDQVTRGILAHAVGRAICCPQCGNILDVKRAVLVEYKGRNGIACASCFDRCAAKGIPEGAEIIDGRLI